MRADPRTEVRGCVRAARLRDLLGPSRFARQLVIYGQVSSTNDVARRMGRDGAVDGTVVVAEEQTRGRGRRERRWESPRGGGIYVSVLLRLPRMAPEYPAAVQLAAGIALAEAVGASLPQAPELLWPNDLYHLGRKLAGVLVESETSGAALDFLVCGIGVNVDQDPARLTAEVARVAGSVRQAGVEPVDREALLCRLLQGLEAWDDVARGMGIGPVIDRWLEWSPAARGAEVELETAEGVIRGRSDGLSQAGGLRVRTDAGVRDVLVGELIRVRRRT